MPKGQILVLILILILSMVFLIRSDGAAKTMYVTETTWVKVNSGPGSEYKVIARVKTGDPVTVLGQEGGWYHIRTAADEEGWIMSSLLTEGKPLTDQVNALATKTQEQSKLIAQLSEENKSLKKYAQMFENSAVELNRLKEENLRLKDRHDLLWLGVGAGILSIGWIIGLITGSFYRRGKAKYRYSFD
ncbi:MAG: TIGR04211 family SH3 domain-containing protein [bacterium]|nr:TIGR04211 family SH3 domain-containing protein [bacterium]